MKPWLGKTVDGKFAIEKIPCPHPHAPVDLRKPPAGVMHTTEGSFASAMSVFRQHYAPHFLVGPHRIAQLVPLGDMAAALENPPGGVETNAWARVQVEVAGFSKKAAYSFDAGTTDALASLLATLKLEADIPLARPFPDAMPRPSTTWPSTKFKRRLSGKWGIVSGWYGHVEVPENRHWDPGALKWAPLLLEAQKRMPKIPLPAPKPKPKNPIYNISVTNATGHTTTVETTSPRLWLYRFGNFQKKGIVSFSGQVKERG